MTITADERYAPIPQNDPLDTGSDEELITREPPPPVSSSTAYANIGRYFNLGQLLRGLFDDSSKSTPEQVIKKFVHDLQRNAPAGVTLPPFVDVPFQSAMQQSAREKKCVLVFLHSDLSPDADLQVYTVLASDRVKEVLTTSQILLWGCSIHSTVGLRAAEVLDATGFPFFGIVAPDESASSSRVTTPKYKLLWCHDGLLSEQELCDNLRKYNAQFETRRAMEQMVEREREQERMLREAQQLEYSMALAADEERERKRAEEEAQFSLREQELEEEMELQHALELSKQYDRQGVIELCKKRVLEHPEPDVASTPRKDIVVLRITLPGNIRAERKFLRSTPLFIVSDFIIALSFEQGKDLLIKGFQMGTTYPRRIYDVTQSAVEAYAKGEDSSESPDLRKTLGDLNFSSTGVLLVTEKNSA